MIKVKILPNITKFWWVDFEKLSSVTYHCFFRPHVCLSNSKHTPSHKLLLTARKPVFSHLNYCYNSHLLVLFFFLCPIGILHSVILYLLPDSGTFLKGAKHFLVGQNSRNFLKTHFEGLELLITLIVYLRTKNRFKKVCVIIL